jgi:hypothetical protein
MGDDVEPLQAWTIIGSLVRQLLDRLDPFLFDTIAEGPSKSISTEILLQHLYDILQSHMRESSPPSNRPPPLPDREPPRQHSPTYFLFVDGFDE